jgi:hypothetical protein
MTSEKNGSNGLSLTNILDVENAHEENLVQNDIGHEKGEGWDEEDVSIAKEGYCIECEGASRSARKSGCGLLT